MQNIENKRAFFASFIVVIPYNFMAVFGEYRPVDDLKIYFLNLENPIFPFHTHPLLKV